MVLYADVYTGFRGVVQYFLPVSPLAHCLYMRLLGCPPKYIIYIGGILLKSTYFPPKLFAILGIQYFYIQNIQ